MKTANQIGFLLNHLTFNLMRQNDQVLQEQLGIGFSQFKILRVLEAQPHIQQKQIAESLGQTEASISRQIKLLHEKGLLHTEVRPENRRQHITTLTAKGQQCTQEAIQALLVHHKPLFDQLSAEQQEQLLQILQIMHTHMCMGRADICQRFIAK